MNVSGAVQKTLSKENLEQLISAKDTTVTFSKQNEEDHTFKVWSHFSTVFVNNKKQDFILFSICFNNYVYSYFESWKTNKLSKEVTNVNCLWRRKPWRNHPRHRICNYLGIRDYPWTTVSHGHNHGLLKNAWRGVKD